MKELRSTSIVRDGRLQTMRHSRASFPQVPYVLINEKASPAYKNAWGVMQPWRDECYEYAIATPMLRKYISGPVAQYPHKVVCTLKYINLIVPRMFVIFGFYVPMINL